MITKLEELSIQAWPALETLVEDGWILRYAEGYTKRANSVYPLYPSRWEIEEKIAACETFYTGKKLPTIFKLTPAAHPADLDQVLEEKGYKASGHTSVQTVSLEAIEAPSVQTVRVYRECTHEWLEDFCRLSAKREDEKQTMSQTLRKIVPTACYVTLFHEEVAVACGLGVLDRGYIGLYDIVTDQRYRGQGFGKQLVLHLLQWGFQNGAKVSYLQVLAENLPARRLYEKLGYQEVYVYWYRIKEDIER